MEGHMGLGHHVGPHLPGASSTQELCQAGRELGAPIDKPLLSLTCPPQPEACAEGVEWGGLSASLGDMEARLLC